MTAAFEIGDEYMDKKIIIFDTSGRIEYPDDALDILSGTDYEIISSDVKGEPKSCPEFNDADILLVTSLAVTEELISKLKKCRGIIRYGIGLDNIDIEAANAKGIKVANVPDFCVEEVSDHCVALLYAFARNLFEYSKIGKGADWNMIDPRRLFRMNSYKVGIIGYGRIGRSVARKLSSTGMKLLAFDPYSTRDNNLVELISFQNLLAWSDIICITCPLNNETYRMIGQNEFDSIKKGACLINVSRGSIVDEAALIHALKTGRLGFAALDVLEKEPPAEDNALLKMDNVIITPHVAWYSEQAQEELIKGVFKEIKMIIRLWKGIKSDA